MAQHKIHVFLVQLAGAVVLGIGISMVRGSVLRAHEQQFRTHQLPFSGTQLREQLAQIGYSGKGNALLVVSNFQCPACVQLSSHIDGDLRSVNSSLALVYVNMPLESHPMSLPAAGLAEVARRNGVGKDVSNQLWALKGRFTQRDLEQIADQKHLSVPNDRTALTKMLSNHRRICDLLKVKWTPTLVLLTSQNKVLLLTSPQDAQKFME